MSDEQQVSDFVQRYGVTFESVDSFHKLALQPLKDDLAIGVREITRRIRGREDWKSVRSMYNIIETTKSIPWIKYGSQICVQMSSYRAKIWSQERRAWASHDEELLVKTHLLLTAALQLLMDFNAKQIKETDLHRLAAITAETVPTLEQLLRIRA